MRVVVQPGYEHAVDVAMDTLIENDALSAAQHLLDRALSFLPELLAKFPHAGRDFVLRNPATQKVAEATEYVHALPGTDIELREFILDDYLVLYAIQGTTGHLLTLRRHR